MGTYDQALICTNGHVINAWVMRFPQHSTEFCAACGARAVVTCERCDTPIRGAYSGAPLVRYGPPAFCYACGAPFPWTEARLQAARDLAANVEGLNDTDRAALTESLPDLAHDTPRTKLAATRVERILRKVGGATANAVRDIVVDIASETAKKLIWPT